MFFTVKRTLKAHLCPLPHLGGGLGRRQRFFVATLLLALLPLSPAWATEATDDDGNRIVLEHPAKRIVSLAPHTTEMLFAAGAGDRVVGVVSYSDYPPQAKKIPRVGSNMIDLEQVLALKPDLVVAWKSGNGERLVGQLRHLGLTVFVSEPTSIEIIAANIAALGRLAGTGEEANKVAASLRERRDALKKRYGQRPKLKVFYQVWNAPLMTVNGDHLISHVIELCGGTNIFADLPALTPTVSLEGVLAADPDVILTGEADGEQSKWLKEWDRWPGLKAVRQRNLYHIKPDLLQRNGPRILDGAELVCGYLERARGR